MCYPQVFPEGLNSNIEYKKEIIIEKRKMNKVDTQHSR